MSAERGSAVILSLGSNLGDRSLNLRRAVVLLSQRMNVVRVSAVYETAPVHSPDGSGPFLNLALLGLWHGSADGLLTFTLSTELALGRRRSVKNAPRSIDIDIVLFESVRQNSARLQLPHPRFRERNFVLAPLREIVPPWWDVRSGRNLRDLQGEGEVRVKGALW